MPNHINSLIHLTGRVGRAEYKQGLAICLVNQSRDIVIQKEFVEIAQKTGNPGLFLVNSEANKSSENEGEEDKSSKSLSTGDFTEYQNN